MYRKTIVFIFILSNFFSHAQGIKDTSIIIPMFRLGYSLQMPFGDLDERFGMNSSVGLSFILKTKSNWLFGVQYDGIFGNHVNENGILDSIKTSDGNIINQLGEYATILISQRGFFAGPQIGYMYSLNKPNRNSGVFALISGGFLQHRINIENRNNDAPQIMGEYAKGYDRLTNGFALKETLGYMYFDNKTIINFYAGIEFYQAWTKSRREMDYDLMVKDTKNRLDLLLGIRIGWTLPVLKRTSDNYFYY